MAKLSLTATIIGVRQSTDSTIAVELSYNGNTITIPVPIDDASNWTINTTKSIVVT